MAKSTLGVNEIFSALQVIGEGKIKLRSDDAAYLELMDRWWNVLLPKIGRYLYNRGGNILMVQVCFNFYILFLV